jgi:Ca2+-binding EF-hand superfamily protein
MKGKMLTVFTLMTVFVVGFSYAAGPVANSKGNLSQETNKINTQVRYQLTYQEMDKNTDGQVTKEEYQDAIKQRREKNPGLGANQNANMFTFEELDLNGDAQLSQEEFNQHLATTNSRRLKQ